MSSGEEDEEEEEEEVMTCSGSKTAFEREENANLISFKSSFVLLPFFP